MVLRSAPVYRSHIARVVRGGAKGLVAVEAVEARSQSEEAYARILERIVCLEMAPGSVVNEARLREELKIGRTPIREALQRLARENLVRCIPHRGTFVTDVNITDLARITEVRVVIESHAARLAAEKLAAADREAIEELLELLHHGYVTDQRALMQLDRPIHRTVYPAPRNPFPQATLERYFNLSLRLWYLVIDREVRLPEPVHDHVDLLQPIPPAHPHPP